jgi:predicted nucleic acid-binding protein
MLGGAHAVVPALWHLEMANGLAVAERRGILTAADAERACVDVEKLLEESIETYSALVPVRQALETAKAFKLSAYDAAYLEVARQEKLPLASMDEQLRAAARATEVILIR